MNKPKPSRIFLIALALAVFGSTVVAEETTESQYIEFEPVPGLSGPLTSVGSDTLENLTLLWADRFKAHYPDIDMDIQATGSSTAPPALLSNSAMLAPMSRLMTDTEVAAFEQMHGYKPTPIIVAIDALAVYVHKDNPIEGLTFAEVDALFSINRACGAPVSIDSWSQLLAEAQWRNEDVLLYGRNLISGTHVYFRQHALCGGEFKPTVNEKPGSASVVQAVGAARNSIGYSGIGYSSAQVRAVPLARAAGKKFVEASADSALAGSYPLARLLYIYINKAPDQELELITAQFIALALSGQGQRIVSRAGFIPLPARVAQREIRKIK